MKAKWIAAIGVVCLAGCEYDPTTGKIGRPTRATPPCVGKRDYREVQADWLVDSAWRVFGPPEVIITLPEAPVSPQRQEGETMKDER